VIKPRATCGTWHACGFVYQTFIIEPESTAHLDRLFANAAKGNFSPSTRTTVQSPYLDLESTLTSIKMRSEVRLHHFFDHSKSIASSRLMTTIEAASNGLYAGFFKADHIFLLGTAPSHWSSWCPARKCCLGIVKTILSPTCVLLPSKSHLAADSDKCSFF
jgi:hypothetical protein